MKEVTITFTANEFVELAKQLYLASYLTIGFPYDNEEMAYEIYNKVCETGYDELPGLKAFMRLGPMSETEFGISKQLDDETEPVIEQYEASAIQEHLPYALADRDFIEKYGKLEPDEVFNDHVLLEELVAIQNKYKQEFELYGVTHLRLEERA
jgi:hypothetical protein